MALVLGAFFVAGGIVRRAALRCRARSHAGRLDEDRSIDDAAGLLNSADIILITVESRTRQQYA